MIFSTSGFQKGAIQYADANGIATIIFLNGDAIYETRTIPEKSDLSVSNKSHIFGGIRCTMNGDAIGTTVGNHNLDTLTDFILEKNDSQHSL